MGKTGERIDKNSPGVISPREFHRFTNAVFEHFGLCKIAEEAEADLRKKCDLSSEEAKEAFTSIDTNHSGVIS